MLTLGGMSCAFIMKVRFLTTEYCGLSPSGGEVSFWTSYFRCIHTDYFDVLFAVINLLSYCLGKDEWSRASVETVERPCRSLAV